MKSIRVLCGFALVLLTAVVAQTQPGLTYKVLASNRTSTMQKEMQAAGAEGYRFVAVMGGETALGGREVVVLMEKRGDEKGSYDYRLLAANRTSTLQRELQEAAGDGFAAVGQTVFRSAFGGAETATILERDSDATPGPRYEYKLIATSRTSTLQKELQEAADEGFAAIDLTVGQTALGGNELVVIMRRLVK